jgi:LCP family protein required for cell wall assembly
MPDDREPPSEYDWLYSPGRSGRDHQSRPDEPDEAAESAGPDEPAGSDEEQSAAESGPEDTQQLPAAGDDASGRASTAADAAHAADPEATQSMAAVDGDEGERGAEHTQVIGQDPAASEQPAPPSFGGVYPTPPAAASAQRQPDRVASRPPGGGAPPRAAPPASQPRKTAASGGRKRRNWWLIGAIGLIVAWLIFLIAVPIWAWTKISKVDAEPPEDTRPPDTPGTTYLLVGSDSREGLSKEQRSNLGTGQASGERTDTIIMLHVPSGDGPRLLLSIPRDSYVDIPGHGMNKINAAFSFGGPELLVRTVEHATHIRIDDYIEVGFTGFVDIVDAVGGITVCPETAVDDPKAGGLKMNKGCQEVDGHTALDYSRSRAFPLGDITRAEHQREVIAQVGKKAASWQTVVFPWRYWSVNHAAAESLQIGDNVGPIDLTRFAWAMSHTGAGDAKRCVVPFTSLGTQTDVGSVVTWDDQAAQEIFQSIREDDTASIHCTATGGTRHAAR